MGACRPRAELLERRRGLQHAQIVEPPPDDLQSDRQAVGRKAAWHAGGRIPGHVERVGEIAPTHQSHVLRPVVRHQLLGREGGHRNRRASAGSPSPRTSGGCRDIGHLAFARRPGSRRPRHRRASLDTGDQAGVHLRFPLLQMRLPGGSCARTRRSGSAPARRRPRGRHLLHRRAQFGEAHGRGLHQRGDLGIDAGDAQDRGCRRCACPDALMQPRQVVRRRRPPDEV